MYVEKPARSHAGAPWLALDVVLALGSVALFVWAIPAENGWLLAAAIAVSVAFIVIALSFYMLQPSQAAVLMLFGDYRGTDRKPGLRIANPLYTTRKVSLRVRNFTTTTSKVNDANGNPIEIAAVVVWRVTNTAQAVFGVDEFVDYVETQSESAVRQLARSYPYDSFDDTDANQVAEDLESVSARLKQAGVPFDVRQLVRGQDPADDLIAIAAETNAEFIVIGLRRRTPVGKLILGSNAQRVLLDAECPVLAVKASS